MGAAQSCGADPVLMMCFTNQEQYLDGHDPGEGIQEFEGHAGTPTAAEQAHEGKSQHRTASESDATDSSPNAAGEAAVQRELERQEAEAQLRQSLSAINVSRADSLLHIQSSTGVVTPVPAKFEALGTSDRDVPGTDPHATAAAAHHDLQSERRAMEPAARKDETSLAALLAQAELNDAIAQRIREEVMADDDISGSEHSLNNHYSADEEWESSSPLRPADNGAAK